MYRVLCDGFPIYDLRSEELVLLSPKVTLQDSNAGSFDFTITHKHPKYDDIHKMSSNIQVFQDDEEIFAGRITEEKGDFYKRKNCHCEGELAYLNDTTQEPHEYHDQTVRGFLNTLLTIHNNKVASGKRFQVGIVTVTDPNDSLYRYTNFETTLTCINDKLVKSLGGHLRIRKEGGVRYLDYLADSPRTNTQAIRFGENLLDFSKNFDMNDLATVIIPLGARLDESPIEALEAYTTIESVNSGKKYLKSDSAVSKYGWIEKVVKWDNVNVPQILKDKCQAYLNDIQFEDMVLEIKAVDLHNIDVNVETIHLLDTIRAVSEPHGMDRCFSVTKLVIPLEHPSQATFTLGTSIRQSLTSSSNNTNSDILKRIEAIPQKSEIMKEAIESATQLIHNALNGHVVTTPDEQLIMDTDDKETASKVWRWNLNGFGYSNTGYNGTYETAITMDGGILGKFIVANSISSDKIDINYRTEVEHQIQLAEENANGATDIKLASYYTKSQIETTIKNTKDSILLSASETATAYTDGKLKNYYTSAQIDVTTSGINTEVKKRVNYTDVISAINQSAESISIKANKIKLEGLVTANKNFKILTDGSIEAVNGKFKGAIESDSAKITGGSIKIETNSKSADNISLKYSYSGGGKTTEYYSCLMPYKLTVYEKGTYTNASMQQTYSDYQYESGIEGDKSYFCYNPEEYSANKAFSTLYVYRKQLYANAESIYFRKPYATDTTSGTISIDEYFNLKTYGGFQMSGIGTYSTNANVCVNGSGSFYRSASSSKRYKENITDIDEDLDPQKLYNLKVHSYTYKNGYLEKEDKNIGKRMIGLIAEEVEEVYPRAAEHNEDGSVEMWSPNILVPAMLKLIQMQHDEIIRIKERLNGD